MVNLLFGIIIGQIFILLILDKRINDLNYKINILIELQSYLIEIESLKVGIKYEN